MILQQYRQLYFSDARGINTAHVFRILKFSTAKNGLRLNAGDRFLPGSGKEKMSYLPCPCSLPER